MHQSISDLDIRPYKVGDSPHLLNIDLKGNEFPFSMADWRLIQNRCPHWKILIATIKLKPCGFVLYDLTPGNDTARIHKLAANSEVRKIGVISFIFDVIEYEFYREKFQKIEYIVPSHECRGASDPYDKSAMLSKLGFRCVGVDKDIFNAYGEDVDGFIFRKIIKYGDNNEQIT